MVDVPGIVAEAAFALALMVKALLVAGNAPQVAVVLGVLAGGALLLVGAPGLAALQLGAPLLVSVGDLSRGPKGPLP